MACQLAIRLVKTACQELEFSMRSVMSVPFRLYYRTVVDLRESRLFPSIRRQSSGRSADITDVVTRRAPASCVRAEYVWIQGTEFMRLPVQEWPIDEVPTTAPPMEKAEFKKKVLSVQDESREPLYPAMEVSWSQERLVLKSWTKLNCTGSSGHRRIDMLMRSRVIVKVEPGFSYQSNCQSRPTVAWGSSTCWWKDRQSTQAPNYP